ncbi:unnamed protein product [Kluyveromyces dobzhanskii CBS 2104]|uniref:WGS project CCBQ000000000 data, contig 00104 n=1 Tax=Kluyveromyces dobzhanskii CBS 2104 TaxID=1427455 RepID=A0A0A8L5P9_9SACH|nr:unnamed protein product [Kluyveromyces dobzhanskii CBS 2104]
MSAAISKKLLSNRNALYTEQHSVEPTTQKCDNDMILTFAAELYTLGYQFSRSAIIRLKNMPISELVEFRSTTISVLEDAVGADVKYVPLFRKFPDSIPDRSALVWAIHETLNDYTYVLYYAIHGEWSSEEYNGSWFGRQYPQLELKDALERPELVTDKLSVVLNIADRRDVLELFHNLASSGTSTSSSDKEFVKSVILTGDDWKAGLPQVIPNKENLAYIISCAAAKQGAIDAELGGMFITYMKTTTDILRVAAAFSESDVSLANHTRFKLSNSQRRFLLSALDKLNTQTALEDMLRFLGLWLVLAKYLHVNAYSKRFPKATQLVQSIRGNRKIIQTFNRTIESSIKEIDLHNDTSLTEAKLTSVIDTLKERPGDFARRLDHVLRSVPKLEQERIVSAFLGVAPSVATPLLLNLSTHFQNRHEKSPIRVYLPKGSAVNAIIEDKDNRTVLPPDLCFHLHKALDDVLISRFSHLDDLGSIYVDPILQDYMVPVSLGNASESLHTFGRGSKIRFDKSAKVIRLFLYWENVKNPEKGKDKRVDVDLSCLQLSEDFVNKGQIAYYNLQNAAITHSGDFTDAPNGAAEFIDIKLDDCRDHYPEARYIAMTVNSFSGQSFSSFLAKAGFMIRDGVSGKAFEPRTVGQKFDVQSSTKFNIPMILDLHDRTIIWLDLGISQKQTNSVNLNEKASDVGSLVKYAVNIEREKASLLKLIELHGKARAQTMTLHFDPEVKYDNVFNEEFASKVDEIAGKFLV